MGEGLCAASLVIEWQTDARELPEADGRKFGLSANCVCCVSVGSKLVTGLRRRVRGESWGENKDVVPGRDMDNKVR